MNSASDVSRIQENNMHRRRFLQASAAAPFLASFAAKAAAPVPVRFASVGGSTEAGIFVAQDYGFFAQVGIDLKYQRIDNAAGLLAAIATEQIETAGISLTPGLLSSVQQGINLRIVGDKESLRPGFSATQLVTRNELAEGSFGDILKRLQGRPLAVSGRTSASYLLLGLEAERLGLKLSDFHVVELIYANMIPALASGAIDAAVLLEPFLTKALLEGGVKSVCDFTDVVPAHGGSIVPVVYSEKFIANRPLAEAWMLAYMRGVRVYNDAMIKGTDRDRVQAIVARGTGMPLEVIQKGIPIGFDPNQEVSADFLDEAQKFFLAQKFLRTRIDVRTLIDPSFAEAATRVLGHVD
jgi:NitT/TauT family transport system substrate-binding protein